MCVKRCVVLKWRSTHPVFHPVAAGTGFVHSHDPDVTEISGSNQRWVDKNLWLHNSSFMFYQFNCKNRDDLRSGADPFLVFSLRLLSFFSPQKMFCQFYATACDPCGWPSNLNMCVNADVTILVCRLLSFQFIVGPADWLRRAYWQYICIYI